ncbi:hypothetical protein K488DRAFT_16554, partial [Vararia minispora EC-137]
AVLTRWTSHFLSYRRLLQLEGTLKSLMAADIEREKDKQIIFAGDAKTVRKAKAEYTVIKDETFWRSLRRAVQHLEPLAIA